MGVRSLWNGVFFGKPAADCPSVSANGSYHAVAVRGVSAKVDMTLLVAAAGYRFVAIVVEFVSWAEE